MVFKNEKFKKIASYLAFWAFVSPKALINVHGTKAFEINNSSNVCEKFLGSSGTKQAITEALVKYVKNLDPFLLKNFGVAFVSIIILCIIIKQCSKVVSCFSLKGVEDGDPKPFLDEIKKYGFYSKKILKKGVFLPLAHNMVGKINIKCTENALTPDSQNATFCFTFCTYKQLLSDIYNIHYNHYGPEDGMKKCLLARFKGVSLLLLKNGYSSETSTYVANFLNFLQLGNILENTWSRNGKDSLIASIGFLKDVLEKNFSKGEAVRTYIENRINAIYLYESILKKALCKKYNANIDDVLEKHGTYNGDLTKINNIEGKNWKLDGGIPKDLFGNILSVLYSKFNEKKKNMMEEEVNVYNILVDDLISSIFIKKDLSKVLEGKSDDEMSISEKDSNVKINIFKHRHLNQHYNDIYYVEKKLELLCKLFSNEPVNTKFEENDVNTMSQSQNNSNNIN